MISVIVFSKDRPLQLHAYLESLLRFSDVKIENISILYTTCNSISYEKVKENYKDAHWIAEENFDKQLRELVLNSFDKIMFGCDDVVFTGKFCCADIEKLLDARMSVMGVSIRLGTNIIPAPTDIERIEPFLVWNWSNSKERHYNYPWELDCTVYRKEDVIRLLAEHSGQIKNPNFFESEFNKNELLLRPELACYNAEGKAIVITVNRVQEDFENPVDESLITDVESLGLLYNMEGNTLDIEKISKKHTNIIHVGADFFILRNFSWKYNLGRALLCKESIKRIVCKKKKM